MNNDVACYQSVGYATAKKAPVPPARMAVAGEWLLRSVLQLILIAVLAMLSYLLVSHYVLQTVQVVGPSMNPTLHDADHYFLNRWIYHWHAPRRSDIVVIKDPSDGAFVVKRIVAMPGESIYFKNGRVFVNGKELFEPYLLDGTSTYVGSRGGEVFAMCGKDQYFVLGDNRNNSFDSRFYGPVRRQNILGAVIR